jgi:hypothetical protein
MIYRSKQFAVAAGSVFMLHLHVGWLDVAFAGHHCFRVTRAGMDSAGSAVIAYAVHGDIIDDRLVVNVHVGDVHIVHRTVVEEVTTIPVPAAVSCAKVAEAVINATVETDVRTPVAGMPYINTFTPAPVTRRP